MDTKQLVADAESLAAQLEADSDHWAASDNRFDAFRLLRKMASALSDPAEATQAGAVPAGWRLVPVEITEAMHVAAVRTIIRCHGNDDFPPGVWGAMLAAAPQAPVADAARAEPLSQISSQNIDAEIAQMVDQEFWNLTADATQQPARASEAGEASFEKWFAGYHEEACKQFGGIDCTNPKGIAEDAWNAARAPAQQAVSLTDDARDAAKYRAILAEMQVGAVSTQLPLSCSLYWIGPECNDARHADEVIDAALQSHSEGEAS
jgi:hypothetical protein